MEPWRLEVISHHQLVDKLMPTDVERESSN